MLFRPHMPLMPRTIGERRQVEAHPGAALHHGHRADAAKLVYHGVAGDEGTIADHYVAGDQHAIGQDDFVADDGVVADMAVGHKKILRADPRVFAGRVGAVNGDVFAEEVSVADDEPGRFAAYFKSCGASPITQPVWKRFSAPIVVWPVRCT